MVGESDHDGVTAPRRVRPGSGIVPGHDPRRRAHAAAQDLDARDRAVAQHWSKRRTAVVYDEKAKARVLSENFQQRYTGVPSLSIVNEYLAHVAQKRPASDFLARMTYLELQLRLPELLLTRIDKLTMAHSMEARVPFLDHHLVEYAMGVPRALKVRGKSGKHILKKALEPILPHDLLHAPKRGFGAPIREWFRTGLEDLFETHVMRSTLVARQLFDYRYIAEMLAQHRSKKHDWSFNLWTLLNLSLWYERWIEPR